MLASQEYIEQSVVLDKNKTVIGYYLKETYNKWRNPRDNINYDFHLIISRPQINSVNEGKDLLLFTFVNNRKQCQILKLSITIDRDKQTINALTLLGELETEKGRLFYRQWEYWGGGFQYIPESIPQKQIFQVNRAIFHGLCEDGVPTACLKKIGRVLMCGKSDNSEHCASYHFIHDYLKKKCGLEKRNISEKPFVEIILRYYTG